MRRLTLVLPLLLLVPVAARAQGTLVVSQNQCSHSKQGQIRRLTDSLFLPIAQELVNEGKLISFSSAYHTFGDEWNVVFWYTAIDIPAFLAANTELVRRVAQRHPSYFSELQACSSHKDNFYVLGKSTTRAPMSPPSGRE